MSLAEVGNLNSKSKAQLVDMVKKLTAENAVLKEVQKFMEMTNKRLESLEREQYKMQQYSRRDTIEISGIPTSIEQNGLEDEVIKIFEAADVFVHGEGLRKRDIQACHRIGKKGATICKFTNRKFARESLFCGKNLKGKKLYDSNVYINNSFCDEFRHINYLVRTAKKNNQIFRWKIKNGVNFVMMEEGGNFEEISHQNDLVRLKIIQDSE